MTVSPRKQPRQARSKATVDAILDAAARVLVEDGYDKLTTNRIAKIAGVSIGSLYQYFPNKQAVALAVADRHAHEMITLLGQTLTELSDASIPVAVRTYVKTMIDIHAKEPELHQALVQLVLQVGLDKFEQTDQLAVDLISTYLAQHCDEVLPNDPKTAAWVLMTSVEALTHMFALKQPDFITQDALADEITAIVLRYLYGQPTIT